MVKVRKLFNLAEENVVMPLGKPKEFPGRNFVTALKAFHNFPLRKTL